MAAVIEKVQDLHHQLQFVEELKARAVRAEEQLLRTDRELERVQGQASA